MRGTCIADTAGNGVMNAQEVVSGVSGDITEAGTTTWHDPLLRVFYFLYASYPPNELVALTTPELFVYRQYNTHHPFLFWVWCTVLFRGKKYCRILPGEWIRAVNAGHLQVRPYKHSCYFFFFYFAPFFLNVYYRRTKFALKPVKLRAALFYSQLPDLSKDSLSLHGGCPVVTVQPYHIYKLRMPHSMLFP